MAVVPMLSVFFFSPFFFFFMYLVIEFFIVTEQKVKVTLPAFLSAAESQFLPSEVSVVSLGFLAIADIKAD